MLGLTLLVAATALSACAGPSDPTASSQQASAYHVGSRIKQPDVAQPNVSYYGGEQLSHSTDQTIGSAIAHAPATPVPPSPQ
jgi:hypothetical protein